MSRKKIKLILLALILVGAIVAVYIYKEVNRKPVDTASTKPDFVNTALFYLEEFQQLDSVAGKKYNDKLLQVEGMVKEVSKNERGFYTVSLGDSSSMSSVRCSIDSASSNNASELIKGSVVIIKGICSGYNADELLGSDLILVRCYINK